MKYVTASEARKNWFRILDEVAAGEVVAIERAGRRIVVRREDSARVSESIPAYGDLISAPHVEEADRWGWEWRDPEGELADRSTE